MKLIAQGAEAKIFLIRDKVVKDRVPKAYRHPQLDNQIRRRRTKSEAKILTKALAANINVPKLLADPRSGRMIHMQYIKGDRLSETLNDYDEEKQFKIMQQLGEQTALLHENNLIHGDLTTSNVILKTAAPLGSSRVRDKVAKTQNMRTKGSPSPPPISHHPSPITPKIYIIDFGLGFVSTKQEDKAVDLHLIKQALEAKHFQNHEDLFKHFCKGYLRRGSRAGSEARQYIWQDSKQILERLEIVEKRGRYKH